MTRRIISKLLLLILVFGFLVPTQSLKAAGASLYLSPSTGTHVINSTFRVSVMVNSGGEPINAAEGSISYDTNLLEATGVSKGNIFMFWTTEPSIGGGTIKFGGGNPSPYTGSAGHVITVSFKAKKAGTAAVRFTSGAVLANDGKGTNILASMGTGSYTISPKVDTPKTESPSQGASGSKDDTPKPSYEPERIKPEVKSSTHPDQNKWYQESELKFSWSLPSSVTGVSIGLDDKAVSDPGPVSDGKFSEKTYKDVDGLKYLHIKFKDSKGWGTTAHYRVMIDKNPPKPFSIDISNVSVGDWPLLKFETEDEESGLLKYEVFVGSLEHQAHELEADNNSIELEGLEAGSHTVLVKAIDKAGNQRVETAEFVIDPIPTPVIEDYPEEIKPGDNFYVSGTALENSKLIVVVEQGPNVIASTSTMVDSNGKWLILMSDKLAKGRYTAHAIAINEKGIRSGESAKVSFLVSPPVFAQVGEFIIGYFTVIVSLIFMIILIVLLVFFLVFIVRRKLRKETIEAEEVIKRNMTKLRTDMDEEFDNIILKTSSKKDKTTAKERLDGKFIEAEKKMMKEVQDVEDLLK